VISARERTTARTPPRGKRRIDGRRRALKIRRGKRLSGKNGRTVADDGGALQQPRMEKRWHRFANTSANVCALFTVGTWTFSRLCRCALLPPHFAIRTRIKRHQHVLFTPRCAAAARVFLAVLCGSISPAAAASAAWFPACTGSSPLFCCASFTFLALPSNDVFIAHIAPSRCLFLARGVCKMVASARG